ncbi:MAG: hypothetical protein JRJ46_07175 [Deltaproteobacteria bacterium]|nr:hypothetical protein [Deltaproteobacteria bacterium]
MKKWKCTVCGYVHEGDEPPEKCPVCGADRSKFVEVSPEEVAAAAPDRPAATPDRPPAAPDSPAATQTAEPASGTKIYDFATALISKHHIHPISVHIPNGVAPAAVIFIALATFFQLEGFAQAAFYNMAFVLLAMPLVLFSGYVDWQKRFGGNLTGIFWTKIVCGFVVLLTSIILVGWRIMDPDVAAATSANRWAFFGVHLVLLCAAGIAGFCGGKLVFNQD